MDRAFSTSGYEFILEKNNMKGTVEYAHEIGKHSPSNLKKIKVWLNKLDEFKKIKKELKCTIQ